MSKTSFNYIIKQVNYSRIWYVVLINLQVNKWHKIWSRRTTGLNTFPKNSDIWVNPHVDNNPLLN